MSTSAGVLLALLLGAAALANALNNGLARTPPMGFANWNGFGCNYNDTTFRQQADFLVSSGPSKALPHGIRFDISYSTTQVRRHRSPATPQHHWIKTFVPSLQKRRRLRTNPLEIPPARLELPLHSKMPSQLRGAGQACATRATKQ